MARRLVAANAAQVAPPVLTPWGDRNARVQAPEGMQLTLFTPEQVSRQAVRSRQPHRHRYANANAPVAAEAGVHASADDA
jgi:hypothetical protein